jgi:hypothetical protein
LTVRCARIADKITGRKAAQARRPLLGFLNFGR